MVAALLVYIRTILKCAFRFMESIGAIFNAAWEQGFRLRQNAELLHLNHSNQSQSPQ